LFFFSDRTRSGGPIQKLLLRLQGETKLLDLLLLSGELRLELSDITGGRRTCRGRRYRTGGLRGRIAVRAKYGRSHNAQSQNDAHGTNLSW
jgi:hypothetical protein